MSKRLTDNISSQYVGTFNKMRPRTTRKRIIAYVEGYDDVAFWRSVLDDFETDTLYFEVMLPSRTTLGKGKKTALMNKLGKGLGEWMIACVDADYDWLLQGQTPSSKIVCQNPYVLHTYVYAIENYQCYAPSLHQSLVMATLNDHELLDVEAFMTEYSCIIWPLFVWNVWCYRQGHCSEFSLMDFATTVSIDNVNIAHPERMLETVRRKVNRKVGYMQHRYTEARETYQSVREELLSMGITPETTYLFMHGHTLMDSVVLPVLSPVCTTLRRYREKEIARLAIHEKQRQNELSSYQHSEMPIEIVLRKSTGYRRSAPYRWLRGDIERLLNAM